MKTITSRDFQKNIGATLDLVNSGETVRVTRYGRSQCIVIPDTPDSAELLRYMAGRRLSKMLRESKPNEQANALTQEEVNQLIHECLS